MTESLSAVKNADVTTDVSTQDDHESYQEALELERVQDVVRVCDLMPDGELKIERVTQDVGVSTLISTRDVRVVDFEVLAAFPSIPVIDLQTADDRDVAFAMEVLGHE